MQNELQQAIEELMVERRLAPADFKVSEPWVDPEADVLWVPVSVHGRNRNLYITGSESARCGARPDAVLGIFAMRLDDFLRTMPVEAPVRSRGC